jgi:hypothetical protein
MKYNLKHLCEHYPSIQITNRELTIRSEQIWTYQSEQMWTHHNKWTYGYLLHYVSRSEPTKTSEQMCTYHNKRTAFNPPQQVNGWVPVSRRELKSTGEQIFSYLQQVNLFLPTISEQMSTYLQQLSKWVRTITNAVERKDEAFWPQFIGLFLKIKHFEKLIFRIVIEHY